jgi:hypothetical protein
LIAHPTRARPKQAAHVSAQVTSTLSVKVVSPPGARPLAVFVTEILCTWPLRASLSCQVNACAGVDGPAKPGIVSSLGFPSALSGCPIFYVVPVHSGR